ncbi:MAG TPA: hypothetical protein VGT03_08270 [Candidatus Acidoferrales bacterium]|nr:hypothetical protein [Candidatus Acidoferrales bacterium]
MSWKFFSSDATSIEGPLRIPMPPPYAPYAEAWKEFDRLDRIVHNRGPYRWVRSLLEYFIFGGAGLFGLNLWKSQRPAVIAGVVACLILWYFVTKLFQNRYENWPCPRCHSVWPGTKEEKDPACKVCGLRLHQLAP